jgi:hypothetical protein
LKRTRSGTSISPRPRRDQQGRNGVRIGFGTGIEVGLTVVPLSP